MFGNREKDAPMSMTPQAPSSRGQSARPGQDTITAYLGPDTSVEGTLKFEHSVLIEGKFKGEIHSEGTLVIGEGAHVQAQITSRNVTIKGKIEGSIEASERVQIQSNGIVLGDITTPSLQMDESVTFEGRCSMGKRNDNQRHSKGQHQKDRAPEDKILEAVDSVKGND